MSPLTRRRLALFRQNRRGYWSAVILGILLLVTLPAEFIANDRPLAVSYAGFLYFPVLKDYPETTFGGDFETYADYGDAYLQRRIHDSGWILWPAIPFSYRSPVTDLEIPAPAPPSARNWLGTDDQQRDVLAWLIYSLRTSLLFGFAVAALCSVIGVLAGSVEGFFGGWIDLVLQRLTEIWVGLPVLFLLIIMASIVTPTFWNLLLLVSLFAWMPLAQLVRAEVLRVRALDYVRAGRALGLRPTALMVRHMLPNALVATFTYLPFELTGAIATLAALDLIGYGMPPGSPSLGTLLNEGRTNLQAPWLGLTGFFTLAIVLTLLTFLGEAVRDAFDPRRQVDRPATPELP
ncbi:MAG TPA: ABC transporter permease [Alphaproteobacteria bacterium]|jgi:microcin C transport system permease protein|nr:ABC transporter permease [Alphaproteobacteria bacterium]